jgi:MSHA pilin protein MshB
MNSKVSMKKSSGFTLIELVIVVVILGFLAVTAIPKFLDLTDQAKRANIEGMAGGFATAISLARAQWEAEGRPKVGSQNSVNYDGSILILTTEATNIRPGYVTGISDGASLGTGFDAANCVEIWQNILQQPPNITNSLTILNDEDSMRYYASKSGGTSTSTCHFYLKETLERAANGDYTDPGTSTDIGNSFIYQPANSNVTVHINTNVTN